MTSLALRFHSSTMSFIPQRQERRIDKAMHEIRIRISRRRFKQNVRALLARIR